MSFNNWYDNDVKKYYFLLIIVLVIAMIVVAILSINRKNQSKNKETISINNHQFEVELATTQAQREYGLMNRSHLDETSGMLFVFSSSGIYPFWMKNTKIPLDIIWFSNNKIVDMTTLQPATDNNIPEYSPRVPANLVLEINAGLAQKYGFKIGDELTQKTP